MCISISVFVIFVIHILYAHVVISSLDKGSILCTLGEFLLLDAFWDAKSEEWLYLGI